MKFLITLLLALIGSVALALYVLKDPGYLLISYQSYTVETTLSFAVLMLLLLFVLLFWLMRFGGELWHLPGRMRAWRLRRQRDRAQRGLQQGLLALAEGNWKLAERTLARHAVNGEAPLLNYLAAARAAQQQHALDRRDHYLHMAFNSAPAARLAIGLTQAELQLAGGQLEQSLATLTNLEDSKRKHDYVLGLLVGIYRDLHDWQHLQTLLPELRKRKVLQSAELKELEVQVYIQLMQQAGMGKDLHELQSLWKEVPRALHEEGRLLCNYVRHLVQFKASDEAEDLVRNALRRSWSDELVALYGQIESSNPARQLSKAEGWLKDRGRDAVLHLALARICMRNRLWGKARIYFETSIAEHASVEAYHELGALLEQLEDKGAATECYRQAAILAVGVNAVTSE